MLISVTDAVATISLPVITPSPQASDGELAQRWGQGDREAGAQLIARHERVVRAFLRRLVSRADWADDLAQETFLRLLTHAQRYDPRYPMRTWLLTIARRLYLNHAQLAHHRAQPMNTEPSKPGVAHHEAALEACELQSRLQQQVQLALACLHESQRTALVLFYQQDMPVRAIAQVMKIPEGTVKSHLSRGRAAMRQQLEKQGLGATR